MIRAVMVTPGLGWGGAERWVVDLLRYSDPSRLSWNGCVISSWGRIAPELLSEIHGIVPVFSNYLPNAKRVQQVDMIDYWVNGPLCDAVWSAAVDADIVVTWGLLDTSKLFKEMTIPRVFCSQTAFRPDVDRCDSVWQFTHLAAVDRTSLAFFDKQKGSEYLPKTILYNGSDPNRCRPTRSRKEIRAAWGISEDALVIGYIGRHDKQKNPFALAKAVMALGNNSYAVYSGSCYSNGRSDNHFLPELVDFCQQYIPLRWRMFMPTTHIGDILEGIDVFLLASFAEGFSLALIEAWLSGVPVVATPVGSIPEMEEQFGPLVTRIPIEPSAEETAAAIRLAMNDIQKVERAKRVAWEHLTSQAMAARWTDYLESVVTESKI